MVFSSSAMRSVAVEGSFQEHELAGLQVITHRGGNGAAAAAAAATLPWWVEAAGSSQPLLGGEPFGQLRQAVMVGHHHHHHQTILAAGTGEATPAPEQRPSAATAAVAAERGAVELPVISGDPDLGKELKFQEPPGPVTAYLALQQYQGHFDLALGQSMVCTNDASSDQSYGAHYAYGAHALPGRMILPSVIATKGLMYVNARQFNGIIRRRLARAKNRISRNRKPYLHESRHRHAKRRARGSGGRFLNTKNLSGNGGSPPRRSTDKSLSSGIGPDNNNNNGDKNSGNVVGQTESASKAMSMYPAQDDMAGFRHLRSPSYFPSLTMDSGGEARWATMTPHGCCDLLKL